MKRLIYLLTAFFFVILSCNNDDPVELADPPEHVVFWENAIQFDIELFVHPDTESGKLNFSCFLYDRGIDSITISTSGKIDGKSDLFGNILQESAYTIDSVSSDAFCNGILLFTTGILTTEDGDSIFWTSDMPIAFFDPNFYLVDGYIWSQSPFNVNFENGTGKYENAKGICSLKPILDKDSEKIKWYGKGGIHLNPE